MKIIEKIKTHVLCLVILPAPSPENRTIYKMMWKNRVEPDNILRYMRIACWLANATDTH